MEQHRREGPALKYKNEMQKKYFDDTSGSFFDFLDCFSSKMHLLNLFRPPKAYFLKNKDLVDSNGCLLKHKVP